MSHLQQDSQAEATLAKRIRAKDPEAIREVVETYLGQVYRAARGAGLDDQRAQDVTQDTFVTFIEGAIRFEGRSHVRTWLFGILYNKISEARRHLKKDQMADEIDSVVEQRFNAKGGWVKPPPPADLQVYSGEFREMLEECLERVSTPQRMVFLFREIVGLDSDEICKVLGITRTNLGVLFYRVRNSLRECLESKGIRG